MGAETGYVLADGFRDGNVPAAMNNVPLIERAFAVLPDSVTERFVRADSACYDEKVLKWLAEPSRKIGFAISADMTKELRSACVALDGKAWSLFDQRADMIILPPDLAKARPKRLRLRVFALAAKVISHARQIVARVAKRLLDAADLALASV